MFRKKSEKAEITFLEKKNESNPQPVVSKDLFRPETIFFSLLGGVFIVYGLKRRPLKGLILAALGGGLLYRTIRKSRTSRNHVNKTEILHQTEGAILLEETLLVKQPADKIYSFFRDLRNLSLFFHFPSPGTGSHDQAVFSMGQDEHESISLDAQLIADVKDRMVAWSSKEHAPISHEGTLYLRPKGLETELTLMLKFDAPATEVVAMLLGQNPVEQLHKNMLSLPEQIKRPVS